MYVCMYMCVCSDVEEHSRSLFVCAFLMGLCGGHQITMIVDNYLCFNMS